MLPLLKISVLNKLSLIRNVYTSSNRLSIAYFGSDQFSVHSLSKLVTYHRNNTNNVSSIDVITRSIKATGRKLKSFVDLPIGDYCASENITIHRADSSQEIMNILSQGNFNLAIAVSYGKLIPEDFIKRMEYGGLNVHPSLLPRYSGSSPLQYALMNNDPYTGVTVQTLHPTKFDKGDILLQSGHIPIEDKDNYYTLENKLGECGAGLLLDVIDKRLFEEPRNIVDTQYEYTLASKIIPSQSEINWNKLNSKRIKKLNDALGQLHTFKFCDVTNKKKNFKGLQKVIIEDIKVVEELYQSTGEPGDFVLDEIANRLIIKTIDGGISVGKLKFQYCKEEDPITFMKYLHKRSGPTSNEFVFTK